MVLKRVWGPPPPTALTWEEENPVNYVYEHNPIFDELRKLASELTNNSSMEDKENG